VTAEPQRFSVLALLYLVTSARVGSGEHRRRVQRVMARAEREAVTAVLERLPATVAAWSDGLAALEPMHIVEVRRQLTSLSSSGEGRWWAGPRDCRVELAELIADRPYDSVIVLWPAPPDLALCGWGCTVGASDASFGAGFSSIETGHWPTLLTDPDPEQGYVHEWLHQVESVYRGLGLTQADLPELHATIARAGPPAALAARRQARQLPADLNDVHRLEGGKTVAPGRDRRWKPLQDGGHRLALRAGHDPLHAPTVLAGPDPRVGDQVEEREDGEPLRLGGHRRVAGLAVPEPAGAALGEPVREAGGAPGSAPTAIGIPVRLQSLYDPG
jgi:hypothetical protein